MKYEPAFPRTGSTADDHDYQIGLTKREYFAAQAMQALLTGKIETIPEDEGKTWGKIISERSVEYADALIKELEK